MGKGCEKCHIDETIIIATKLISMFDIQMIIALSRNVICINMHNIRSEVEELAMQEESKTQQDYRFKNK